MDGTFEIERCKRNILLVGTNVTDNGTIYEICRDLNQTLVPNFFDNVIVVKGLKGAYHIKK